METQRLQREIKKLLKRMNWSQSEAAKRIYCEKNDSDNDDEISRFIERFKKQISRKTTNSSVLESYYDILCIQREVVTREGVALRYIAGNILDPMIMREIISISREISDDLKSSCEE